MERKTDGAKTDGAKERRIEEQRSERATDQAWISLYIKIEKRIKKKINCVGSYGWSERATEQRSNRWTERRSDGATERRSE